MKRLILFLAILLATIVAYPQHKDIKLEDIFHSYIFFDKNDYTEYFFSKDGKNLYEKNGSELTKISFDSNEDRRQIIGSEGLKYGGNAIIFDDIQLSESENKILAFQSKRSIYRRSFSAIVYVYDLASKELLKIDEARIMYPSISPDGTKVAYVKNRDIWVYDFSTRASKKITFGGDKEGIMNGMSDWVYEEEFSLTKAYEWSKDSKSIAYIRMNETRVPEYSLPYYLNGENRPSVYTYKYPKSGDPNSLVSLNVVSVSSLANRSLSILQDANGNTETDIYIPWLSYTPDNRICAMRMNRLQNKMELLIYPDSAAAQPHIFYTESDKAYVDISNIYINFINDGKDFLITSEKEGYNQLYLYNLKKGFVRKLTSSPYDIDKIAGYDEKAKLVYYMAAYPTPMDRTVFKVNMRGKVESLTGGKGWHSAQVSSNSARVILTYSNAFTPPELKLIDIKSKSEKILADNDDLHKTIELFGFVTPEYIQINNREGKPLNVSILKPPRMEENKKYPILFFNYGGPGSQEVVDKYETSNAWKQMMCQKGYIVVSCDNTGTGFRGADFKKKTYLRLGELEIQDQIDVAKFIGEQPYADAKRIGHIGWSFGGFMSALAITKGADVFSAAVAIAPVTHWKYYDNIYTERFMRRPSDNADGYETTSPLNEVFKMKGKFLIIHGTGDDNVHIQNTYSMVEEMTQRNKHFDMMIYPDKRHGISGGNTTYHLWQYVTDWIFRNL